MQPPGDVQPQLTRNGVQVEHYFVTVKQSYSQITPPLNARTEFLGSGVLQESLMRAPRPRTHSCRSRGHMALTCCVIFAGAMLPSRNMRPTPSMMFLLRCPVVLSNYAVPSTHFVPLPSLTLIPSHARYRHLRACPVMIPSPTHHPRGMRCWALIFTRATVTGVSHRCLFAWNALLCISVTQTRMTFAGELL